MTETERKTTTVDIPVKLVLGYGVVQFTQEELKALRPVDIRQRKQAVFDADKKRWLDLSDAERARLLAEHNAERAADGHGPVCPWLGVASFEDEAEGDGE